MCCSVHISASFQYIYIYIYIRFVSLVLITTNCLTALDALFLCRVRAPHTLSRCTLHPRSARLVVVVVVFVDVVVVVLSLGSYHYPETPLLSSKPSKRPTRPRLLGHSTNGTAARGHMTPGHGASPPIEARDRQTDCNVKQKQHTLSLHTLPTGGRSIVTAPLLLANFLLVLSSCHLLFLFFNPSPLFSLEEGEEEKKMRRDEKTIELLSSQIGLMNMFLTGSQ